MAFVLVGWLLLVAGMVVAATVGWLTSRRFRAVRILGRTLAAALAIPAAWVIFMLIADNGMNPRDLRLAGFLVIPACTLVIGLALAATVPRRMNGGTA